jgi:hypothetical protein
MNRIKKLLTIALLAASLVACRAARAAPATGPQAIPSPTAQGTLSEIALGATLKIPATLASGEEVNLEFTLINSTRSELYVLKWYTPLEGIMGEIFDVKRDGQVVPYEGILAYRGVPSPEDYVRLDAGGSASAEVDLADAYDFSQAGEYTITFISPRISHVARTEGEMAKTLDELGPVQIASEPVTVRIEGGAEAETGTVSEAQTEAVPVSPSERLPVPTVMAPAQEVEPGITIVGTVLDVSFSAHVIALQEPVAGFGAIALTEASELVSVDQQKITLGDIRPGMRVEASGQPGESHALLASKVRLLEETPTSPSE